MTVSAAILGRRDVQFLNGRAAGAAAIISGKFAARSMPGGDNKPDVAATAKS
jgi:hypothetical protein